MISNLASYQQRIPYLQTNIAKKIMQTMVNKASNLCVSADVNSASELLQLADELGPEICMFKTHIDIIDDFTDTLPQQLRALADKHQFILFEDRKFADIGNTVKQQYAGGIYRIADWADVVNAHPLPGPGIVKGLAEVALAKQRGLILLAEMSSEGHLMTEAYRNATLAMAEANRDSVIGFITQRALSKDPYWLNLTPGVSLADSRDQLGQQYNSPEHAILNNGTDIIIVGRSIIRATNPLQETKRYKKAGWDAYQKRSSL